MIEKLKTWDGALVDLAEKGLHWVQLVTGINNFTIAKILVLVCAILHMSANRGMAWVLSVAGFDILTRIFIVWYAESHTKVGSGIGFVNPYRTDTIVTTLRITFFVTIPLSCFGFFPGMERWWEFSLWIFYLALSSTPLPPGSSSKLGDWLRGLLPSKFVMQEG